MEWLCFLTVPEGLPEPAVLLCAKASTCLTCLQNGASTVCSVSGKLPTTRFLICGSVVCQQLSTVLFVADIHVPVERTAMAQKGLLQEEAQGRGKTDFKPQVSQKAGIVGSCTEKMKK